MIRDREREKTQENRVESKPRLDRQTERDSKTAEILKKLETGNSEALKHNLLIVRIASGILEQRTNEVQILRKKIQKFKNKSVYQPNQEESTTFRRGSPAARCPASRAASPLSLGRRLPDVLLEAPP